MCFALGALVAVAAIAASTAASEPGLLFGFTDNSPFAIGNQATAREQALGARGTVLTLVWQPGKVALAPAEAAGLSRAMTAAAGMRVILSVRTNGAATPLDNTARDQFCTYARNAVASFPRINDVVVGNEPNSSYFWRPQYNPNGTSAAPGAYEALLAHCYDVLHALRPTINVAAAATGPHGNDNPNADSNVSHSPTSFIAKLGAAYRASGRSTRIFDTVVHHPYGNFSSERPYLMHPTGDSIGEGDWNRLVQSYQSAFAGTPQPVPGRCTPAPPCVPIWYLETGFQTAVPPSFGYFGSENVGTVAAAGPADAADAPATSLAPDQGSQLRSALRLAYCQPYVTAMFNFLIRDDANLAGYQSGIFWTGWVAKPAWSALYNQVADLAAGRVSCAPPTQPPAVATKLVPAGLRLTWSPSSSAIGVSGYTVLRNGSAIGTSADPTYTDASIQAATTYSYSVRAYDAAGGTSPASRSTTITTPKVLLVTSSSSASAAARAKAACKAAKRAKKKTARGGKPSRQKAHHRKAQRRVTCSAKRANRKHAAHARAHRPKRKHKARA